MIVTLDVLYLVLLVFSFCLCGVIYLGLVLLFMMVGILVVVGCVLLWSLCYWLFWLVLGLILFGFGFGCDFDLDMYFVILLIVYCIFGYLLFLSFEFGLWIL